MKIAKLRPMEAFPVILRIQSSWARNEGETSLLYETEV